MRAAWPLLLALRAAAGEIRIEVRDPSGAPVEASVKAANTDLGIARTLQTDSRGIALLTDLPAGAYRLEISRAGFTTQIILIEVRSAVQIQRTITLRDQR